MFGSRSNGASRCWCGPGWKLAIVSACCAAGVAMATTTSLCVLSGEPCEASAEVYGQRPLRCGKRAVPVSSPAWFDPSLGEVHVLHTRLLRELAPADRWTARPGPHHEAHEVPENFL